jgi:predicted ATP-dependent endonuclease of OLD family
MLLRKIEIYGFRSVTQKVTVHLEPKVTVIVGANDHGKTNLLHAVTFLNPDSTFDEEADLSWDHSEEPDQYPRISFELELTDEERKFLAEAENKLREGAARAGSEPKTAAQKVVEGKPKPGEPSVILDALDSQTEPTGKGPVQTTEIDADDVNIIFIDARTSSNTLRLTRSGIKAQLSYQSAEDYSPKTIQALMERFLPRVELIQPWDQVTDSTTMQELKSGANEFMKGIFYHAGLDAESWETLFEQNDATTKRLSTASDRLDSQLKKSWSEGRDLKFRLDHNSAQKSIELRIDDPSVGERYVKASRRSQGFTHYFALKTILFSRRTEHPARSYVWLFDEPGVYLHPSAQHDLIHELEAIGLTNQVVYSTHSVFMINKTFPTRHRLVRKGKQGTEVEGKPYSGRWKAALSALGISIVGTIMFANHILLMEGDADPILLQALLQKLAALGKLDVDLNGFTAVSTGEARNAHALLRIFLEVEPTPQIAMLFDGDSGGIRRHENLRTILDAYKVPSKVLTPKDTTLEDHIPLVQTLYVRAVARYVGRLLGEDTTKPPTDLAQLEKRFQQHFAKDHDSKQVTSDAATWAKVSSKELAGIEDPSKVGVAREYIGMLEEIPDKELDSNSLKRAMSVAEWVQSSLGLPRLTEHEERILKVNSD